LPRFIASAFARLQTGRIGTDFSTPPDRQRFGSVRGPTHGVTCLNLTPRFNGGMPELTRRRYPEVREECWHVFYGDVHVGAIAIRTGMPWDEDPWGWSCGFYPGSHPGECTNGAAPTFDQARADFEEAWAVFLFKRTEADFQEWRDQRDWTERMRCGHAARRCHRRNRVR
jgi:hypothetical protein